MNCENCVRFLANSSAEDVAKRNYCTGNIASDGAYTWGTPVYANDEPEILNGVMAPPPIVDGKPQCFAFKAAIVE